MAEKDNNPSEESTPSLNELFEAGANAEPEVEPSGFKPYIPQGPKQLIDPNNLEEGLRKLYSSRFTGSENYLNRTQDESQYDESFNETMFTTDAQLQEHRIEAQGWGAELTNAVLGGLAKVPGTILGTVGNLGDYENYVSLVTGEGNDYDNWLTKGANEFNGKIDEISPIYGANTESGFGALGNREWWMSMAKSTIESGTAFAVTGMGVGRGLSAVASKLIPKAISTANALALNNIAQGGSTLLTSALLTHAEGVQLAAQVFDNAYQIHYQNYFKNNPMENPQDENAQKRAENYSTSRASDNAATAHRVNMFNVLLNLSSINRMISPTNMSREAVKKATVKGVTGEWLAEGGQEYLEENVNNIAENIAIGEAKSNNVQNTFGTVLDSIFSAEGFTAGVSGFMGGVWQSGVTDAKKLMSGEFAKQNQKFAEFTKNEDFLKSVEGQKTVLDAIQNGKYTINKIQEINDLEVAGKKDKALEAKRELLQFQAFQSFQVGNGEQYEQVLNSAISQLQKDPNISAEERDNQAQEIKKAFKEAEDIYNETLTKVSPDKQEDIYFNTLNRKNIEKEKTAITIEKARAKAELLNNLENLKFVGLGQSQTGIQREFKNKLNSALSGVYDNSELEAQALLEAHNYHSEKNAITYPGQVEYVEAISKLALNELALSKNIQDYNSIMKGTYSAQKIKESENAIKGNKKAKAGEAVVAKEQAYQDSKQKAKEAVETPVDLFGMFAGANEALTKAPETTVTTTPVVTPETTNVATEVNLKEMFGNGEAAEALKNTPEPAVKVEDHNTPAPKVLLPEEITEFKEQVYQGNTNTIAEDATVSVTNPSDGFYGKKIINGYSAVAIKTVDTSLDDAGNFVKNSDTYLENTNQNILSTNGKIDAGAKLVIKPTGNLFKGDGSSNPEGTADQEFGVYSEDGSLVGYVHEVDWCTENTIAHERPELANNIERNKEALRQFREAITKDFNEGTASIEVKVTSKSSGSANYSKTSGTVSEKTKDPNTKLGDSRVLLAVVKNDGFYVNNTKVDDYIGKDGSDLQFTADRKFFNQFQGMSVMIVPSPSRSAAGGTTYKVVFLDGTSVLPENIKTSIHRVLMAYLENNGELLASFGIDNSRVAVQKYINQFFYSSMYNDNKSNPYYFTLDEGAKGRNIKANTINGSEIGLMYIGAKDDVAANLNAALEGRKFNLDLSSNQNGTQVRFLENGKIVSKPYEQVAKDLSLTKLEGMPLTNLGGEIAYFHNPVLQFGEPEGILKPEVKTTVETTPVVDTTVGVKKRVLKPNPTSPITAPPVLTPSNKDTSASLSEDAPYTVTGLISDKTTGEFIEITKVNDITDTMYNFIVDSYVTDNKLKPAEGLKKFETYAKGKFEFFEQFSDTEFEITAEDIALGALPTHEANARRAADWKQVIDNYEELKPIALEKLEIAGFNFEGDLTNDVEKEKFDASSFELDPITKLSGKMKAFLKSIKADRLNFLQEATYVDFQNLHNKVMSLLANKFLSYQETVDELKKSKDRVIEDVVEKLQNADQTLRNEFLSHFNKEYAEFITAKEGKTFNPNRESLAQIVYADFNTGIQNTISTTLENGASKLILPEESKNLWTAIQEAKDISVDQVSKYLDSIGVTVSKAALSSMKEYMGTPAFERQYNIKGAWATQFGSKANAATNGVFGNIHNALVKKDGQEIPLDSEQNYVKESILDKESSYSKLAAVEAQYRDSDVSPSFVNGQGKTFYGFTLPNAVAVRLSRLKTNSNNLLASLKQISFTKHASWLNQVNDFNFKLFYFDVNNFTGNKEYAKSFHEMSHEEKAKTRITLFTSLMDGTVGNKVTRFISSAKSDKTKAVGVQYNKWNVSFTGEEVSDSTIEQVAAIAYAEYDRILNSQARPMKAIVGYNPNLFYLIPKLNDVEELFYNGKVEPDREIAKAIIRQEMKSFLQDEINFTKEQLKDFNITKDKKVFKVDSSYLEYMKNTKPSQIDEVTFLATDFAVNQLLANYNYNALFTGDPALAFKKDIKGTLDNYFKRLAKDVAPAQRLANSNSSSITQIFINDPKGKLAVSKNIKQLQEILGDKADVYSQIDIADAQEYTSLQEHLDNLLLQGDLEQAVYDKLSEKIKIADSLKQDVKFTTSELNIVLQPIKPVYVHNKPDTLNDVDHAFYIKSSSFPLVPQLVQGTGLYNLMKAMQKNGINRAALMSAAKMGAVNPLNFEDIQADSDLASNISILPREGYGIQQAVPYDETKTEILQGSQLQKLIFEGLGENFDTLKKRFNELQMTLLQNDFNDLKESFGITESENGDLSISDMSKFVELLTEELKSRDYNPNDIDGLRLNKNGELEIPLWFNTNATRMESIILSLFTNRVLKQKLRGKSYVLGSELGLEENLSSSEKSSIVYTSSYNPATGLLPQRIEDGVVKGSQVILAPNFTDAKGNKMSISKFTKVVDGRTVIDMEKIPAELLTCIGYRIPTQGHNSMAYIEIVGFLPEHMADLIIASKDFTKQMGSDFDIDKLYIHFNYSSTDESGNLVKDSGEAVRNEIIDTYKSVLSSPETFAKIVTPLDFGELENVNKSLKKIKRFNKPQRSILSPWQQDDNFSTGTAGKMGVSQTSLLSTFSSLLQSSKASVTDIVVKVGNEIMELSNISSATSVSGRPKIAVVSAFQSASVDNIKELLINTINYNEHTNPALNALALVGLDEYFISYLFTQDSVMEFVEDARNNFIGRSAVALTLQKINDAKTKDTPAILTEAEISHILENPIPFSAEELYANLSETKKDKDYFIRQLNIANFFDTVTDTGKELMAEQAPVNLYTGGLTNNTQGLADKLFKLGSGANVLGVPKLLGHVKGTDNYGVSIVDATTPSGLGYEIGRKAHSLMNKLFPYTSRLVTNVQSRVNISKKNVKTLHDFIKSSLISTSGLFKEDLDTLRARLLFGDRSLAHRWNEFKIANPTNALGKRLEFKLSNSATYPSTIKYTLTSGTRSDDFNIVKTLVEMLNNPASSALAEDTIQYLLMNGGIQLPNNFVKLIPNDYLIKNGFGQDLLTRVNDKTFAELIAPIIEKQFIQHNPEYAFNVSLDNTKKLSQERITLKSGSGRFVTVVEDTKEGDVKLKLYEITPDFDKNENPIYVRIPVLGKGSVVEANIDEANKPSIFSDNNPDVVVPVGVPQAPSTIIENTNPKWNPKLQKMGFKTEGKGRVYVENILDNIIKNPEHKSHAALAQILKKVMTIIPEDIKVTVAPILNAYDGTIPSGIYHHKTKELGLKADLSNMDLERVFLHELLHAATSRAIRDTGSLNSKGQAAVTSLNRLFELAKEQYNNLPADVKKGLGKDVYGFTDLDEFVAEALTKVGFQKTLSTLKFGDKTVYDRFKELIVKLMESFMPSDFHKVSGISTEYLDAVITESLNLFNELSSNDIVPVQSKPESLEGLFLSDEDIQNFGLTKGDISSASGEDSLLTRDEVVKKATALTNEWRNALKKNSKVDLYNHYLKLVNTLNRSNHSGAALKVSKNPNGTYSIATVDLAKPKNVTVGTYYKIINSFQSISQEKLTEIMEKIDKFEESSNQEGLILKELCK